MERGKNPLHFKQLGTGICFVIFPLVWVFAFAMHPNLAEPRLMIGPEELVWRAYGNKLLQFAHVLVTLNTAPVVVIALHFMKLLDKTRGAWFGFFGATMAVLGACLLAADKGALCLAMSAFDQLPESEFRQMMPGLVALFSFKGWMMLVWGLVLMPIGVLVQTVGLLVVKALPPQQLWFQFTGVMFAGFPDGAEIINIIAAGTMAAAMVSYGIKLIMPIVEE